MGSVAGACGNGLVLSVRVKKVRHKTLYCTLPDKQQVIHHAVQLYSSEMHFRPVPCIELL